MKRKLKFILLSMVISLLTVSNSFADWYSCDVSTLTTRGTGIVVVTFMPGENETRFSTLAKAEISPVNQGAKMMYATLLTAASLNKEVILSLDNIPSEISQEIGAVRLTK